MLEKNEIIDKMQSEIDFLQSHIVSQANIILQLSDVIKQLSVQGKQIKHSASAIKKTQTAFEYNDIIDILRKAYAEYLTLEFTTDKVLLLTAFRYGVFATQSWELADFDKIKSKVFCFFLNEVGITYEKTIKKLKDKSTRVVKISKSDLETKLLPLLSATPDKDNTPVFDSMFGNNDPS